MLNLADNLLFTAARKPEAPALRVDDSVLSYQQLLDAARSAARWLRDRGVGPDDRVALILPDVPAFPALFYGALFIGATVVPMDPLLPERAVAHRFSDAGVRAAIAFHALPDGGAGVAAAGAAAGVPVLEVGPLGPAPDRLAAAGGATGAGDDLFPPVPRADGDIAALLYTGDPMGAALTHHNLASNAQVTVDGVLRLGPGDVLLGCLPLHDAFGLTCGLNAAVLTGACLVLLPRFDPVGALELIERHGVTVVEGGPAAFAALLHAPAARADGTPYDTSSLRLCLSGGPALPAEVLRGVERRFATTVLEGYGRPETSPVVSFHHPDRERRPGSCGTPIRGVEVRIVDGAGRDVPVGDVGELAVRGHCVMRGYWGRPDATAAAIRDGWLHTGDLARADADGYLYLVGRG